MRDLLTSEMEGHSYREVMNWTSTSQQLETRAVLQRTQTSTHSLLSWATTILQMMAVRHKGHIQLAKDIQL